MSPLNGKNPARMRGWACYKLMRRRTLRAAGGPIVVDPSPRHLAQAPKCRHQLGVRVAVSVMGPFIVIEVGLFGPE
jgi:hypothetical protein